MNKIHIAILSLAVIVMVSCKNETKKTEDTVEEVITKTEEVVKETKKKPVAISIVLESKSESEATGKARFRQVGEEVKMQAKIIGLTPGTHAIHIHEKADCSSADGKSSGGHWNPTFTPHGKWGDEAGYHKGDIGNFEVGEDGLGMVEFATNEWCIGCGDEKKDIVGKAVIVHQGTDDFTSQPSGAAGKRVSCGGIIQ